MKVSGRNKSSKKGKKSEQMPELLPITSILPYKRLEKGKKSIVDNHDQHQAILKVKTADLTSMNPSDLRRMLLQLTNLCRIYVDPFKIMSMTCLSETGQQQNFWIRKMRQYHEQLTKQSLSDVERRKVKWKYKLAEDQFRRIEWVEKALLELTFFIVVYGDSEKEVQIKAKDMIRLGGRELDMQQICSKEEHQKVMFKMNNMNTDI